jgi:transcriptional regulator with XRE-family HTH domain
MEKVLSDLQEKFMNSKFYERIKYLRKIRNLTIKQAADRCITTEKCWSDWENGRAIPRKRNRRIIALALNVSEEIIFGTPKVCVF